MNAREGSFEYELAQLITKHSWEHASKTPDFILARLMVAAFLAFWTALDGREMWHEKENTQETTQAAPARREGER